MIKDGRKVFSKTNEFLKFSLFERHKTMKRECLKCGRLFKSSWCGHRICDKCEERNKVFQREQESDQESRF
jgi:uncharacterized OB-fold protein